MSNPIMFPGAVPADGSWLADTEAEMLGVAPVLVNVDWRGEAVLSHSHSVESFIGVPAPDWEQDSEPVKRKRK